MLCLLLVFQECPRNENYCFYDQDRSQKNSSAPRAGPAVEQMVLNGAYVVVRRSRIGSNATIKRKLKRSIRADSWPEVNTIGKRAVADLAGSEASCNMRPLLRLRKFLLSNMEHNGKFVLLTSMITSKMDLKLHVQLEVALS